MQNKVRVLIFSNSPVNMQEISGTGNWVTTLLSKLRLCNGYEIFVASHDSNVTDLLESEQMGLTLYQIPLNQRNSKFGKLIDAWQEKDPFQHANAFYNQVINKVKPDIIQIFGLESPFIRILKNHNENVIIHIQGLLAPYQYKYYPRFSQIELLRSNHLKSYVKRSWISKDTTKTMNHLKLENSIYHKIRYVLGRTDWDRRCVKAFAPQARYFFCQEIMRDVFYHTDWKPTRKKTVLLYTTIRDNRVKNVDMIFETAAILDKYNPQFTYQWRVAGVCQTDPTPRIMKLRKVGSNNVKLLGRSTSEEIVSEMLHADLFVYPSAIENGCNAVQEAMLCGMPILCTYAGGMSSTIEHGVNGILISEGDPYSMAGAILEMLENYELSVEMGRKAREVSRVVNSPTNVIAQLETAYASMIDDFTGKVKR